MLDPDFSIWMPLFRIHAHGLPGIAAALIVMVMLVMIPVFLHRKGPDA